MQKIVSCKILPPAGWGDKAKVMGTFADGTTKLVLDYYHQEVSFSPDEFVGLTEDQAHDLFHRRDVAYLQAP